MGQHTRQTGAHRAPRKSSNIRGFCAGVVLGGVAFGSIGTAIAASSSNQDRISADVAAIIAAAQDIQAANASPSPSPTPTTSPTPSPTPTTTPTGSPVALWTPTPGVAWQWEISSPLAASEISEPVQAFDIDGFDNTAQTVTAIHAAGKKAICYIDVGTAENFRSDYASIPKADEGKTNGWPGETWLNITDPALRPIMQSRIAMCALKGFDALEPDNMDGTENSTGFSISAAQQIAYDTWVAQTAHSVGLSVAQKNFVDQSQALQPSFDFVIDEQCVEYSECTDLSPYYSAGKAVLDVEYKYGLTSTTWCSKLPNGAQGVAKNLDLDDPYKNCPNVQPFGASSIPTPTPTPTLTPTAPTAASGARLFADTSLWNTAKANGPFVTAGDSALSTPSYGINNGAFDHPFYIAKSTDPATTFKLGAGWGHPAMTLVAPAPSGMAAASGSDGALDVQLADGRLLDMYGAKISGSTVTASFYGLSDSTGTGFGVQPFTAIGTTAIGAPQVAGTILAGDIAAGTIPHALDIAFDYSVLGGATSGAGDEQPPAVSNDDGGGPGPLCEGCLLLIPSTATMPVGLTTMGQALWHAAQTYGVYITDQLGGQPMFYGDGSAAVGAAFTASDLNSVGRALHLVKTW